MGQARDLLDGTAPLYFEVDARVDGDNLRLTAQRIQKLDEVVDMARQRSRSWWPHPMSRRA